LPGLFEHTGDSARDVIPVDMGQRQRRVLILSTTPAVSLALARSAALAGIKAFVISDERFSSHRWCRHARHALTLTRDDLTEPRNGSLEYIDGVIARLRIDAVVPADTLCTRMLARLNDRWKPRAAVFPLPSSQLFDQLNHKGSFAQLLAELSLPHPHCLQIGAVAELDRWDGGFPAIVKPTWSEAGFGVVRVDDQEALEQAVRTMAEGGQLPAVVQTFIPGRDIDLSLLANRGHVVAWTIQRRGPLGHGVIHFTAEPRVLEIGRKICEGTGYHGVAHIDMRMDERTGQLLVIEFNPRFWGSLLYSTWIGVNFLERGLMLTQEDAARDDFVPVTGTCPYLAFTPTALLRWIGRGATPPTGLTKAQVRAWKFQMLDPGPELVTRFDKRCP
jgi:predicted ATP-grasp superfamily ATP-dependent carboligase